MKNKIFLILIGIGLLITLAGLFMLMVTNFESGTMLLSSGLSIVNLLGLILLIKNGSILKTIYFKIISLFITIVIFGAMFKIMHWPGATILLMIGLIGIPIVYIFRFINKPAKAPLDVLKLLWVVISYTTTLAVVMHWLPREVTYIPNIIMLATVIYFASNCLKDKTLLER